MKCFKNYASLIKMPVYFYTTHVVLGRLNFAITQIQQSKKKPQKEIQATTKTQRLCNCKHQ